MNSERHLKWTGVNNELILMNLRLISDKGKDYQIRMPLIEGVNCNEENIRETLTFLWIEKQTVSSGIVALS